MIFWFQENLVHCKWIVLETISFPTVRLSLTIIYSIQKSLLFPENISLLIQPLGEKMETCFKKTFFALVSHEAVVFVQNVGICSALFTRSLSNFLFYLQLGKTLLSFFMSLKTLFIYTIQGSLSSLSPNVPIVLPTI